MGHRTTTVCDAAGCLAERENPVTSRNAMLPLHEKGWGTFHASDEKTGYSCSYDLCPSCSQKIATLLGLKSVEDLFQEQTALRHTAYANLPGLPGLPGGEETPPEPPKHCETCKEPYVGASCYFCPPSDGAAQ
jgi:hypothetical protein